MRMLVGPPAAPAVDPRATRQATSNIRIIDTSFPVNCITIIRNTMESYMAQPCRLIELAGAPHERGVQYGREAAGEISRSVGHYGAQARAAGLDQQRLAAAVRE